MTRTKVLYDISVLEQVLNNSGTGIFFTAQNILDQLVDDERIEVTAYMTGNLSMQPWLEERYGNKISFFEEVPSCLAKNMRDNFCRRKLAKKEKRSRFWLNLQNIGLKIVAFVLRKRQKITDFNVFFSPVFAVPDGVIKIKGIRKYVLLYDVIPLLFNEYYHNSSDMWFFKLIEQMKNGDASYFAISEQTKREFLKYMPVLKKEQIKVTPLAAGTEFYKTDKEKIDVAKEKYGIPANKKYVFSLCTLEPRKNLIRAVKTFVEFVNKHRLDDIVFALGGGNVASFMPILEKELEKMGADAYRILLLGRIADSDLAALYSGAHWFVYTSQYEGFGLPPLEAMSCGCPVITSNNTSLPEVVGDAGIMIDWDSEKQHISAYEQLYFDERLRSSMAERGMTRSKQFSWKKTTNLMIEEFLK